MSLFVVFLRSLISIKDYLVDNVYNDVTAMANLKEAGMFYNNHGEGHINTIIHRASDLVKSGHCTLSPKETYFLLCAILIHDSGMLYGRIQHEENAKKIIAEIRNLFSTDSTEQIVIFEIAKAHGGEDEFGDKDKIKRLKDKRFNNELIRTQLIASILRFADELSEERKRASNKILQEDGLDNNPSEVYHAFSSCVSNVYPNHSDHTIHFDFSIPVNFLNRKFQKHEHKVLLIDEIYERLLKVFVENKYCQKYMGRLIPLYRIHVTIEFIPPHSNPFDSINVPENFSFTIAENGYPEKPIMGIYDLCDELILNKETKSFKNGNYFQEKFNDLNYTNK